MWVHDDLESLKHAVYEWKQRRRFSMKCNRVCHTMYTCRVSSFPPLPLKHLFCCFHTHWLFMCLSFHQTMSCLKIETVFIFLPPCQCVCTVLGLSRCASHSYCVCIVVDDKNLPGSPFSDNQEDGENFLWSFLVQDMTSRVYVWGEVKCISPTRSFTESQYWPWWLSNLYLYLHMPLPSKYAICN